MSEPVYLYRYDDRNGAVVLTKFLVKRTTRCGVWIEAWGEAKFVNQGAVKQYANRTQEGAKTAFLRRKERQIRILRAQLVNVEAAVTKMNSGVIGAEEPECDYLELLA